MAFPLDDIQLGPQSFGLRGTMGECDGIIWHTTEAAGTSRNAALGTVEWQKKNPGSYNFIIYDGGIMLTVPYLEASGGVNPASRYWAPERYSFLAKQLPSRAYNNPNEYQLNVSFSGRTADFAAGRMPENMIETAARLVLWVREQPWASDLIVQSGHMHWQTNRSDPSALVLKKIQDKVIELSSNNPFIDIDGHWAKNDILATTEFGLWAVPADKKFNPEGTMTRAQAAALLNRLIQKAGLKKV